MRTYVEDPSSDERFAWTTMVIILVMIIGILIIGYFAWWAPSRETTVVEMQPTVTTPVPQAPPVQQPTVVIPGPQGAQGPSGTPGPAGPSGESGPSGTPAPSTPAAPATPSGQ